MPSFPLALHAYGVATQLVSPLVPFVLRERVARGKEDPSRLGERLGHASQPRPQGPLIWIHGASVGECLAALPLIGELLKEQRRHVLVTSGTLTSARLMEERLPPRALHQYVPVDTPSAVQRFLDYWRPDLALFVESELWPNLISQTQARGTSMALVNARFSPRSRQGWNRAPKLAGALFGAFDACLAQDATVAAFLKDMGARNIHIVGSLKADAPPLPADEAKLAELRAAIGTRPVFFAASTHEGEDIILLKAFKLLRVKLPDALCILVPRHPERGAAIAATALAQRLPCARRALGALPQGTSALYIADTLGELGLFYRLAPFAFLGGSLIEHGGQNPLEAARLGKGVLSGPYTDNFSDIFAALFAAQGYGRVHSVEELAALAGKLMTAPEEAARLGAKAKQAAETLGGALARTMAIVEPLLVNHART
jgi:3-deoxy-D-manno-octulosonic-acid transferase